MKNVLKLGAVVLAIVMVLSMSVTAFATSSVTTDSARNTYNALTSTENTIGIAKSIVFVNAEATTVREPNIVYTYTIATTTPTGASITGVDGNSFSMTVPVNAGPLTAVTGATTATTSTVTFADTATSSATSDGTSSTAKYANFTFDPTKFSAPGVYRYQITESTDVTKASVGITEAATYASTRFLDVYVKYNSAGTGFEIYGYALFEGSATTSITSSDTTMKSSGYVNTSTTTTPADVDVYTTQNVEIHKTTTGALADKAHNFPVTITMTKASGLSSGIKLDYTVTNPGSLTKTNTDTIGDYVTMDAALSGTVKDTTVIKITGVPAGSTISLTETNDTVDSYRVKAGTEAGGATLLAEAVVAAGGTSGATTSQTLSGAVAIYITNTLDTISPTGITLRVAPYALMLGVGLFLVLFSRRRKSQAEA